MYDIRQRLGVCHRQCPFCDSSCQFVHRPTHVRSAHAPDKGISGPFERTLLTSLGFQLLFLELVIIDARCGDFCATARCFFFCQFAVSFCAFLRMTFHVVGPHDDICLQFSRTRQLDSSCGGQCFEHFLSSTKFLFGLHFTLNASQNLIKTLKRFLQIALRPVLCCAVLRCAALRCAALRCAALRCAVLCCAVLCCAVLCCALIALRPCHRGSRWCVFHATSISST